MPAAPVPPSDEPTPMSAPAAAHPLGSPPTSDSPPSSAPYISLIGAAAFACACKLHGATNFTLYIHAEDAKLRSALASPPVNTPNLSGVPQEYHDFADVVSKAKATTLARIASMTSTLIWKKAQVLHWVLCTLCPKLS